MEEPKYVTDTQRQITDTCLALADFLIEKNKRYGNSALEPANVFSKLDAEAGIMIRLDDKLKRIKNNTGEHRKNDFADILGYIVLLCVKKGWTDFSDLID